MVSACSGGELVRGEGGKVGSVRKACTSIQTSTRRLPIDAGSGTVSSGSPALSSNMADFSFPTMVRCDRGPRPTPRQRRNRKFLCFEFELPVGTCSTQHRVVRQSGTDQSGRVAVYFVLCKWSKIPPSPLATRPAQPPPPPPPLRRHLPKFPSVRHYAGARYPRVLSLVVKSGYFRPNFLFVLETVPPFSSFLLDLSRVWAVEKCTALDVAVPLPRIGASEIQKIQRQMNNWTGSHRRIHHDERTGFG